MRQTQEIYDNTVINNPLVGTTGSNSWYFYNPTTKTLGHKDFIRVWGNRKLEDNWRRKNKSSVSFTELQTNEPQSTGEQQVIKSDKEKVTNKHSLRILFAIYTIF